MKPIDAIEQLPDGDPAETAEWIDALRRLVTDEGETRRAGYLLARLAAEARELGIPYSTFIETDYINSIPLSGELPYPGDLEIEKRIRAITRWNAVAMVERANSASPGIGGHLSTYASAATLIEVGLNHFFRGATPLERRHHIYFQGHVAPGIYARAFLEGRLTEAHLDGFRREASKSQGLSSYPHPRRNPTFWEFPTVSMGLGLLNAVAQARFDRYLNDRGVVNTAESAVWAFAGDGEMDEPESLTAVAIAGRERLGNLTLVVNCNLQRLDGPVRGNGKIIQELERTFRGADWNVVKVVWGSGWDPLLANDRDGVLVERMNQTMDGQYQRLATMSGSEIRSEFFGPDARLSNLVEGLSDAALERLPRGGHDPTKVYNAFAAATADSSRPTVVLAKSVKGWALGSGVASRNATHQIKHLEPQERREFRDRLRIPVTDSELAGDIPPYYHPGMDSEEVAYLRECRERLGGPVPYRSIVPAPNIEVGPSRFESLKVGMPGGGEATTTAAFTRLLRELLRDPDIGPRIVPIVADESRTFGWDALVSEFHVHSHDGQLFRPVDDGLLLSYREAPDGQIIQEGICEALAIATMTAAGSSYATWNHRMFPIFATYSMFGLQRTADALWAMSDQLARGLLVGGTAGRTSLPGEGLQHCDGQSLLIAASNPACRAYDAAYAYEVAIITEAALSDAFGANPSNSWTYLTLYNEATPQPPMPIGSEAGILAGMYQVRPAPKSTAVRLWGSGVILQEVLSAAEILESEHDVATEVWSITSYQMLAAESAAASANRDGDQAIAVESETTLARSLKGSPAPVVAVCDYQRLVIDQVRPYVDVPMYALGTDGFGLSDERQALRKHFSIDAAAIVAETLRILG